jgi:hypothetical protein
MADAAPTRREAFEPLIALATQRVLALAGEKTLPRDDAAFLLRALFELEADGVGLFGGDRVADPVFFAEVSDYLAARVGTGGAKALGVGPFTPEAVASLPPRAVLANSAIQLVEQSEVKR